MIRTLILFVALAVITSIERVGNRIELSNWASQGNQCDLAYATTTDRYLCLHLEGGMNPGPGIWGVQVNPDTGAATNAVVLTDDPARNPAISWNPGPGRFLMVYAKAGSTSTIWGKILDPADPEPYLSPSFPISGADTGHINPRVACNGTDWMVTWTAFGGNSLRAVSVSVAGGYGNPALGSEVELHATTWVDRVTFHELAGGPGMDYLSVWHIGGDNGWGPGTGPGEILGRTVSAAGIPGIRNRHDLSENESEGDLQRGRPAVTANPITRQFLVGWVEAGSGLTFRLADSIGTPSRIIGTVVPADGRSAGGGSLGLAWHAPSGHYLAAWQAMAPSDSGLPHEFRLTALDGSDAAPLLPDLVVGQTGPTLATNPGEAVMKIAPRLNTDQVLVQWQQQQEQMTPNRAWIYGQRCQVTMALPPAPVTPPPAEEETDSGSKSGGGGCGSDAGSAGTACLLFCAVALAAGIAARWSSKQS